MRKKSFLSDFSFWFAIFIVIATAVLSTLAYFGQLPFLYINLSLFPIEHWTSWAGTAFVVLYTPAYYIFKRRYPKRYKLLLRLHVFGDLFAFLLISVHFALHVSEYVTMVTTPQTGVPLFLAVFILVVTGIIQRFQLMRRSIKRARFIHVSTVITFYVIIVFHVTGGLNIF